MSQSRSPNSDSQPSISDSRLPIPGRPAVFLDRDGTLVFDPPPGYLRDPAQVTLIPGSAAAIARLRAAGYAVVMVSNQAGISRGQMSWDQYRQVAARVEELLGLESAHLDGTYICPHAPEIDGDCPCRKPKVLLYEQAALEHGLDFAKSWWVGDRITDLLPAARLGGRGILVLTGEGNTHRDQAAEAGFDVVPDLAAAAERILSQAPAPAAA
jgi:D-glycero-D-manno-heptose 1,7-bisphosphate phosphatase